MKGLDRAEMPSRWKRETKKKKEENKNIASTLILTMRCINVPCMTNIFI